MKFNHAKQDAEQFANYLMVLGKMMGMSGEQALEHLKEAFPSNI